MGLTSYRSSFRQRAEHFRQETERAKDAPAAATPPEQPSDDGGKS